jgi:hypothetical protein
MMERGEKTASIPSAASICRSVFQSDAVPPCGAAPSIILDEGHRLRRTAHRFFRAVRAFLSGPIDTSAFQEVSLGREVSNVFTSNGPLIYRWEANNGEQGSRSSILIARKRGRSQRTANIPRGIRPEDNEAGCRSTLEKLASFLDG